MTEAQKVIKYVAIGLAFALIIGIILTILSIISSFTGIFSFDNEVLDNPKVVEISSLPEVLKIDISAAKLTIKNSDKFYLETNNASVKVKELNNRLIIDEGRKFLFNNTNSEIILYIPEEYQFDLIDLDAGAGNIQAGSLLAERIEFDLGAGNIDINNLEVLSTAEIDGGVGKINFEMANINNLDLDLGVGNTTLSGVLTGNADVDAGIGELKLNLINANDYTIRANKGIGSIEIDGAAMQNGTYGNGSNIVRIDGGIGKIDIKFS